MALEKLSQFNQALLRLKEAYEKTLNKKYSDEYSFFRDSTIQRFEFTVEIFWKTLKEFLREMEGIVCSSPKNCIREFFSLGYLSEEEARKLLEMIDYRNLTSHTYHEEVAEEIFNKLNAYIILLEKTLKVLEEKYESRFA